jgi:imidazoleglycerol-phosphate dehydratase
MPKPKAEKITVRRKTAESEITVTLESGARNKDLKKGIATPLHFFNHMLETVAWRGCVNLTVKVALDDYNLTHVICEDVGLSLGEAVLERFFREIPNGINGAGAAVSCIDEALARCVLSFEERALLAAPPELTNRFEVVEDMHAADLVAFFEGFVQGARATCHLDLIRGENPHHIWESVFRAFGHALQSTFAPNPWRSGATPGVKGNVSLEKK